MTDLRETRDQLDRGDRSLTEVVNDFLKKIDLRNGEINAFVSVDKQSAIKQAEAIQKKIDSGTAGPLAGVVVGIKDVICEKGKKTRCASNILRNFESVYDATVIKKLREADALFLGRLNMDEFAMGSSTENTIYGPAKNPHDTSRVTGGSSGGSAAAVAAGMCNVALGSDTGGSVRQPASFCGVVGLKPTYGRISRHGLVAFASSFDCIGPVTSTVEDNAKILQVISGFDENDNTSSQEPVPDYLSALENEQKLTVGVPEEYFGEGLDEEIQSMIEERLNQLESEEKIALKPIQLPHMKYNIATYYILATAEASSNLARYDGIRYGHRSDFRTLKEELTQERQSIEKRIKEAEGEEKNVEMEKLAQLDTPLIRLYKKSRTEGFGEEVKRRILLGTYVLSAGYYDAYYAKAQKVRRLIKQDFDKVFAEVDVIVSPTAPTPAFELGAKSGDPVQMYLNDIYTTSANLAGICGISVPVGKHSSGLPVGVQFMGDAFEEGKILRAAHMVENMVAGG
ncbi:MAG: amidase family protein [Balneolaceae bacterium]